MIKIAKVTSFLIFLKTGLFLHSNIASACRFYFALHKTNRTGKTPIQQGGVNR